MLYSLVRPLARLSLGQYFKSIQLSGAENIPANAAVILASNHPTTFLEPCILACYLPGNLHFMARGDFFKHPVAAGILKALHITPVYRMRDAGYQGIKNNYESFEAAYALLGSKQRLMILAEGRCIHEKRLRPLYKGTARIALGALEQQGLDELYIVPVGANFTHADRVRSDVMISCGQPIRVSEYRAMYRENQAKALAELTNELAERMAAQIVIIPRQEDEALTEQLLEIYRSETQPPLRYGFSTSDGQLRGEISLAAAVHAMPHHQKDNLALRLHNYFGQLQHLRLTDAALKGKYAAFRKRGWLWLMAALPLLLVAAWHLPVWAAAQWMAGKKVRTIEFASPVRWAAASFFYLLYFVLWIVAAALLHNWWLMLLPAASLLLLPTMLRYAHQLQCTLLAWRVTRQSPHSLAYMAELRKEILGQMQAEEMI